MRCRDDGDAKKGDQPALHFKPPGDNGHRYQEKGAFNGQVVKLKLLIRGQPGGGKNAGHVDEKADSGNQGDDKPELFIPDNSHDISHCFPDKPASDLLSAFSTSPSVPGYWPENLR